MSAMNGFSRTMKYSFHQAWQRTLVSLGVAVVYSLYFMFLDDTLSLNVFVQDFGTYLLFVSVLFMTIYGLVSAAVNVPEQISFGCIRLHAAMSLSLSNIFTLGLVMLFLIGYYAVMPQLCIGENLTLLLHGFEGMLAVTGLTAFLSVLVMKFGRYAYIGCIMVLALCAGFFAGFMSKMGNTFLATANLEYIFAVASAAMLIIGNIALAVYSKHIEVKA